MAGAVLLSLTAVAVVSAQPRAGGPTRPTPFERYVPATADLFITIRDLSEVDSALHRAHAWRLLPTLAGSPAAGPRTFDLRAAVTALVGRNSLIGIDELMQAEVGIVADSWTEIGGAVWFVRVSDDEVLNKWFPRRRNRGRIRRDPLRSFRTSDGMNVCVQGDVVAMTRQRRGESLLRQVRRLMSQRGGDSLEGSDVYRELASYLPGRHLAIAYVSTHPAQMPGGAGAPALQTPIGRAAVGLYEREGRIELAIRGSRATPRPDVPLQTHAVNTLMSLPQTTLLATAITIDFERAYAVATQSPSPGIWGRYLTILAGLARHASATADPQTRLGSHFILIWGQDLSEQGSTPQIALMVESSNPHAVGADFTRIVRNILKLLPTSDPVNSEAVPTIASVRHLGTTIEHVSLQSYAEASTSASARLMAGLDPAWAVWRDWLILAMSREHLERILDAQHGLIPTLASVEDAQELLNRKVDRTVVALAQAGLAADVLDRWIEDYETGSPSLLAPIWWAPPSHSSTPIETRLGVSLGESKMSGAVVVSGVSDKSSAKKRLQTDDLILGIDGRLLDLHSPEQNLNQVIARVSAPASVKLRVLRGETITDVMIPVDALGTGAEKPLLNAAGAVRELASLGRDVRFATFSLHAAGEKHHSARLSLRFAPSNGPQVGPSGQLP
ncbi:MAG: PDZ domain-containing protein [Phycisphaerales bacterium]|nr:MAG: PDZ domain-containing protein [Phycisphaerales bacterium]